VLNLPYLTFVVTGECVAAEKRPHNAVRAVRLPASSSSVV